MLKVGDRVRTTKPTLNKPNDTPAFLPPGLKGTVQWVSTEEGYVDSVGVKLDIGIFDGGREDAYERINVYYVSGPMQNLPQHNYPAFNQCAAFLEKLGYEVFNPATHNPNQKRAALLRKDVEWVTKSDGIVLLDDWEYSAGACLELADAREFDLNIIRYHSGTLYFKNGKRQRLPEPVEKFDPTAPIPETVVINHYSFPGMDPWTGLAGRITVAKKSALGSTYALIRTEEETQRSLGKL